MNNLQSRIEQQDLYKMYITASSKVGRNGVVTQLHFPRCVRQIFGGTVGPNQVKIKQNNTETIGLYYEGIRIRAKPLAVHHKGTILVSLFPPLQHLIINTIFSYIYFIIFGFGY